MLKDYRSLGDVSNLHYYYNESLNQSFPQLSPLENLSQQVFPHSGNTIVIIHSLSQVRVTDTHPYLLLSPHLGLLLVFIPFSPFSSLFSSTQSSSESCISHSPITALFWWDPANGRLQQEMGR